MNKKNIVILGIITIISIFFSTVSYAGYAEENDNNSENLLTSVVYLNDFEISTYGLEKLSSDNLIVVNNSLLKNQDVDYLKELMNAGYEVVIKYEDRTNLNNINENPNVNFSNVSNSIIVDGNEITEYDKNGYMSLTLENDQIVSGGFYTTAKSEETLIKYYNMYKGYLTPKIKEGTENIVTVSPQAYTTGNYKLRFYWSDSTDKNKVYTTYNRLEGYILNNLYRGEALQDKESMSVRTGETEEGGFIHDEYYKVQVVDNNGNFTEGFYPGSCTFAGPPGEEGWVSDDHFKTHCLFLHELIKDAYDTDYRGARTNGYVARSTGYYGIRIKGLTMVYDSSEKLSGSLRAGNYVWTMTSATNCGIDPNKMTVKAYSDTISSTINRYSTTTYINVGFNQTNPINYKITTRWW